MDQAGSAWIKHASAWMKHERIPESSYGRGTKFARPRPLNLGLETSDIGARSRCLAPRACVDWGMLRGCAPRARASSARRAFIGEQLMLVLLRSRRRPRQRWQSRCTAAWPGSTPGPLSQPWPGLTPGPGRPSLSCVRAGVRCARARERDGRRLSLSLSCWPGVSPESETERRIMRGWGSAPGRGEQDARGRFVLGIYTHSVVDEQGMRVDERGSTWIKHEPTWINLDQHGSTWINMDFHGSAWISPRRSRDVALE